MRGDWRDEAMQYRDVDRKAQEVAEAALAGREAWTNGRLTIRRSARPADGEWDFALLDSEGEIIAETFGRVDTNKRRPAEANARLFANAPELWAALEALVAPNHTPETYAAAMLNARNVLAAATGEKP